MLTLTKTEPEFSIYTPSHDARYLNEAYASILAQQGDHPWEWIVALNNGAEWSDAPIEDARVTVVPSGNVKGVGEAKKIAVALCTAPLLVELDHDDTLEPTCLQELSQAFEAHPDASLVYSRFTQMNDQGLPDPERFDRDYGWRYEFTPDGYLTPKSLAPTPHNVSLIWYAPNHVRAFRRSAYDKTRGYNADLRVLDDQDLMCQLYSQGGFVPIDKMLYRQRMHYGNTQRDQVTNDAIQEETWMLHKVYLPRLIIAWATRNNLIISSWDELVSTRDPATLGRYAAINIGDRLSNINVTERAERAWEYLAPNGFLIVDAEEHQFVNEHVFRAMAAGDDARYQISSLYTTNDDKGKKVHARLIAVKPGYVREGGILYNLNYT